MSIYLWIPIEASQGRAIGLTPRMRLLGRYSCALTLGGGMGRMMPEGERGKEGGRAQCCSNGLVMVGACRRVFCLHIMNLVVLVLLARGGMHNRYFLLKKKEKNASPRY